MRRLLKARELGLARRRHFDAGERRHDAAIATLAREHCCCADAAHPPLRGEVRRALQRRQDPRLPASLHRRGGRSPSARCRRLRPEDAIVATYREHGHALVRGVSAGAIMAEMYGKVEGCSRGRGGSMHLFDAATRFYGGNAIVGGGLPLAVGLRARRQDAAAQPSVTALLLRRGRGRRGRIPRIAESRRAVEAAGAVRVREQPLRDGHRARALGSRDRPVPSRRRATACRPKASTAWTCVAVERGRSDAAADSCAAAAGRISSNSAPTASVRTRCSMPSSIATRPRSRSGRSVARSPVSAARLDAGLALLTDDDLTAIEAASRARSRRRRSPSPKPAPWEPVEDC